MMTKGPAKAAYLVLEEKRRHERKKNLIKRRKIGNRGLFWTIHPTENVKTSSGRKFSKSPRNQYVASEG